MARLRTLGVLNSTDRLMIFDRGIDESLPKFAKMDEENASYDIKKASRKGPTQVWYSDNSESSSFTISPSGGSISANSPDRPSLLKRLINRFRSKTQNSPQKKLPIETIFELLLSNDEEITTFNERSQQLADLEDRARKAGQRALLEQLAQERQVRITENVLFAKGMKRVLTEAQCLKFVNMCEKDLSLDIIRDYTKPIPKEAIDAKMKCDEAGLFDNYAILHYDPENKGTRAEDRARAEAKARDPILFGIISGSRKLYFVADWVDEYCDLTFKDLVDKLNEPLEMK